MIFALFSQLNKADFVDFTRLEYPQTERELKTKHGLTNKPRGVARCYRKRNV